MHIRVYSYILNKGKDAVMLFKQFIRNWNAFYYSLSIVLVVRAHACVYPSSLTLCWCVNITLVQIELTPDGH